jgi:uncharacterized coiled-coil protein SlyX|tara:strand:- start:585 stop:821 length:237 start_codon:yes stop_codon:yes gene_type:complete
MIEAGISVAVAVVSGVGILFTRVNSRVTDLDRRIDNFELRIAENYVPKTELSSALERVESHMIRIENKLDALVNKKCD